MCAAKKEDKKEKKELESLRRKLDEKTAEAESYLDSLKYLKADFENYKKRIERDKEELRRYAAERIIREILVVIDNLERAILAGKAGDGSRENLLEGVEITYKQLMSLLEKEGVSCIVAKGSPFDPNIHECVMTEKTREHEEDTVVEELLKGYKLNDRVIRHSKVKISKR